MAFIDYCDQAREKPGSPQEKLALRIQHFSNGSIKKPNPGENFIQLRYSHSW